MLYETRRLLGIRQALLIERGASHQATAVDNIAARAMSCSNFRRRAC